MRYRREIRFFWKHIQNFARLKVSYMINFTYPLCGILAMQCPVVHSNNLALPSAHAVSTYCESQLGSISQRAPLWEPYVPILSPVSAYHTVGLLSFAHVNNRSPSWLYFTCVIDRSCPFNNIGCYDEDSKAKLESWWILKERNELVSMQRKNW